MAYEIELLVATVFEPTDEGLDRPTNVIAAGLAGSRKWGRMEEREFQRVLWPAPGADAEQTDARDKLVLALNKKAELGEQNPVVIHPFAEFIDEVREDDDGVTAKDGEGNDLELRVMVNASRLQVDFDTLTDQQRAAIFDRGTVVDPIEAGDVNVTVEAEGIDKRKPSERGTRAGRSAGKDANHGKTRHLRDEDLAPLLERQPKRPRSE